MGKMAADFGDNFLQKKLGDTLLAAAAWLPSLLLAPFFAFLLRDGRLFANALASGVPECLSSARSTCSTGWIRPRAATSRACSS